MQQIVPAHGLEPRATASSGTLLWALAGLVLYLLGGVAAVFVTALVVDPLLGAAGLPVEAGLPGLSLRNAIDPWVWGALVAAIAAPAGRRLVPGIRFSPACWLVLGAGLTFATVTWFLLEEFVRARYTYVDLEYVGFSLLTWPALVAVGLCGWAALAVPRGAATPLVVLLVLAAMGLAVALLPSGVGAADGIEAENIPLAVAFLLDVVYAISVVVLAIRRATAPGPG